MDLFGRWVVRARLWIVGVTAAVLALSAALVPGLSIDVSGKNLVFVDPSVRQAFYRYLEEWGSDRYVTVAMRVEEGDVFSRQRLAFLRRLTEQIRRMDMVDRVESLTSTSVLSARGDTLYVGALVPPEIPADPAALAAIRRRALGSPLLRRALVDDRGQMAGINVRFRDTGDDERALMRAARALRHSVLATPPPPGVTLHVTGGPVILEVMYDVVKRDLWVLVAAPLVLVFLVLLAVFRSLRGALFPLAAVIATGLVTFAGMVATGHRINMVTTMLPCLMMVIAVANVIHVLVQHREAAAAGKGRHDAVVAALSHVALPVLLTSATTAVGFGSLIFSDVPQVRQFGVFAAVGVGVALLLSLLSVPAVLALLPLPPRQAASRLQTGLLLRVLDRLDGWSRHRAAVISVAALLTVLGAAGIARLEVESSTREYLPRNHTVLRDFRLVETHLMGTVPIILHVQDETPYARTPARTPARRPARRLERRPEAARPDAPRADAPSARDEVIHDPEDDAPSPSGAAPTASLPPRRAGPAAAPRPRPAAEEEIIEDPEDDAPARPRPVQAGSPGAVAPRAGAPPAGASGRESRPADAPRPRAGGAGSQPEVRTVGRERLKDPRLLAALDRVVQAALALPYVRKAVSITEYLKEVNRVMHAGDPAAYRLPTDRRVIAAYLEMASGQDRAALARLVNFEYSKANLTILMTQPNTRRVRAVLDRLRSALAEPAVRAALGPGVRVEITGMAPMLAHVADRMVDGQLKSFFSALVVISVMLMLVLWSVRVGLLAMLPNVIPIVVTLGLMGWIGVPLNVTTVMIASIALGIAVDDTIHVFVRARRETRAAGGDHEAGVRQTLHSVGRAVVFTSVVLSGGFSVLRLASLIPVGHFGLLVAFTMVTALLSDLVLTPALIHWLRPWRTPDGPARGDRNAP